MALEHLLSALERDAEAEAKALVDEAHREAARIAAESLDRLARRRAQWTAEQETALRADCRCAVAEAQRQARRQVLEARYRLLDRVFRAAGQRLPELARGAGYAEALPRQVEEILSYVDGPALLLCSPELEPAVRRLAPAAVTVRADPDVGPGLRAVSADGGLRVDATLAGRLARLRPILAIEALRQAEAGDGDEEPEPAPAALAAEA